MEDEFRHLIDTGSREGVVDESQKELIKTIFESGDRPVTDILIPRVEIFCLPVEMPMADIVREVVSGRYERIPVYREDRDDIVGILYARDLLDGSLDTRPAASIEKMMVRPYFIPESKTINGLLHDFQEKSIQIAIVVDEYGGVFGLVTLEDILEHMFEEAYGDDEPANCGCDILDEETMIVPGKMPMEQLNVLLSASLPREEFETVGGFVLHLFGKMPERGEVARFEDYSFRVESIGRTRILKIRIEKDRQTGEEAEK